MGGDQPQQTSHPAPLTHADVAEFLPVYVALTLAGGKPEEVFPQVADHLAACPASQAEYDELLALARATYDAQDPQPTTYPMPDLTGLRAMAPAKPGREQLNVNRGLRRDTTGRWLVELTAGLLAQGRPAPLAGSARTDDLLYDLRMLGPAPEAPELRLEVFGAPGGANLYLRVSVDVPELDPFDMGGIEVMVTAGAQEWRALTDDVGTASISGFPRQALEGAQIAVRVGRST